DRHVRHHVDAERRIDDAPALDDEIKACCGRIRHAGENTCGGRPEKLTPVHFVPSGLSQECSSARRCQQALRKKPGRDAWRSRMRFWKTRRAARTPQMSTPLPALTSLRR